MLNRLHKHLQKITRLIFENGGPDMPDSSEKPEELPTEPDDAESLPTDPMQQPTEAAQRAAEMVNAGQQNADQLDSSNRPQMRDAIAPEAIREWSKGYPEVTEFGDSENAIIAECKRLIVEEIKRANRSRSEEDQQPERVGLRDHRSLIDNRLTGGYEYVYIYDTNHTPPDRLFKSPNRAIEAADSADVTNNVNEYFNGTPRELSGGQEYTRYANLLKSRIPNHGDVQSYINVDPHGNENAYVALRDKRPQYSARGGVRIFKGSPSS